MLQSRHTKPVVLLALALIISVPLASWAQGVAGEDVGAGRSSLSRARLAATVGLAVPSYPPADTEIAYDLAALIDLAQRRNPATRIAWERARAAAAAVGLAEAQYYPTLALIASYGGGYWDLNVDSRADLSQLATRHDVLGALLAGAGEKSANLDIAAAYTHAGASVNLRWLLFDFGSRKSAVEATEKNLDAATLSFDSAHQQVAFAVVEAFAVWQSTADHEQAAEVSMQAAKVVEEAAQARFRLGTLTEPDLLQAKSEALTAVYIRETARAEAEVAYVNLALATGIAPGTELSIVPMDVDRLPATLDVPLEEFIARALAQRPDLLARAASLEAHDASLRGSRAAYLPKIGLLGRAGWSQMDNSIREVPGLQDIDYGLEDYGAFLTFEWTFFDGFARRSQERAARAARGASQAQLEEARNVATAQVWRSYVQTRNAVARREASEAMVTAANARFESALSAFKQGLVDMPGLLLARGAQAQAERAQAESGAALLSSLARLALGAGEMDQGFLGAKRAPGAPPRGAE
ncbi:MAG: TolC family protein [Myxococcota bacterium]|jgi:outer membrane protein|nr:TolC family protein [Myxococcota bacterium]